MDAPRQTKTAAATAGAKQTPCSRLNSARPTENVGPDEIRANSAGIKSDDVQARLRELTKLAKEQGYITFDDLNEALPEGVTDADELETILGQLRRMEIDVIEASDVDRY